MLGSIDSQTAFPLGDLKLVADRLRRFTALMQVRPFYAVKRNSDLEILATGGGRV